MKLFDSANAFRYSKISLIKAHLPLKYDIVTIVAMDKGKIYSTDVNKFNLIERNIFIIF